MWARVKEASTVLVSALGLGLGGAGCTGAAPANSPLPSGEPVAIGYAMVTAGDAPRLRDLLAEERLRDVHATRIEDLLSREPGVSVTRLAGGRVAVRIRGAGSFMGSAEPLLVIDGIPVEYDSGWVLRGISPSDVVRIQVLKDASSTAIFGVRGGNGVIMITTRRAR
jgi:TonB-dependent starch-binding outer membrane protein SusC